MSAATPKNQKHNMDYYASETEVEQVVWEWFARAHPHEAHATWPDRFWAFFQTQCPGVDRETMERTLRETNGGGDGKEEQ